MAADLETKPVVPKYEAFIDKQLSRVRVRIRALDAGRSLMLLAAATLAYFLLIAAFDLAVKGDDDVLYTGIRLAVFGLYALVMVILLGQLALRLYHRINPYYAARQLEENIPDAKNSVINWLDLKGQELPGAIRSAVGQRAAKELKQTDPEKVVSPKSNWILGAVLAALALGVLALFAMGPNQFSSLLTRAFAPFYKSGLGTRTEIFLLKPAEGIVTVPLNQRVDFQARIEGRVPRINKPGAPRLRYRYQQAESDFVDLPLDESPDGTWTAAVLADQVLNGFWYKIAAGDAETPEYQVKVQSLPLARHFEATYHYRPYRKLHDDTVIFPNENSIMPRLRDYRGTEVQLTVETNRELRDATVELDVNGIKKSLPGAILAGTGRSFQAKWTLEQRGTFRILFTSRDGETNTDRAPYPMDVLDDQAPRVVLTKPGKDVTLSPRDTLELEGKAQDDIGIKSMALQFKVLEGDAKPPLRPKVYREGKSFLFDDGTYPDALDYMDFVLLDKLQTAQGKAFPLKAGMVIEYWLEATDNADYPSKNGNVGKSEAFKITIADSGPDDKKQQEKRDQAAKNQQQHEKKQDQENAQKNQKRQDKASANSKMTEQEQKDFKDKLDQLKKEMQKQKDQDKQGQAKTEPKPGESKGGSDPSQANNKEKGNRDQPSADNKDGPSQNQKDQAGQAKDEGKKPDDKKTSETKGPGSGEQKPAQAKQSSGSQSGKGSAKDQGSGQKKEQPGQAKNEGQPGVEKSSGAKGNDASGNQGAGAQTKNNAEGTGNKAPQAKGEKAPGPGKEGIAKGNKGDQNNQAKNKDGSPPSAGAGKDGPPSQGAAQAQAKGNDNGKKGDAKSGSNPQLTKKDGPGKRPTLENARPKGAGNDQAKAAGESKGDDRPGSNPDAATAKNVEDLKKQLDNNDRREDAMEDLARIAKEAKDPDVRKAAEDLLEKAQGKDGPPQQNTQKDNTNPMANATDNGAKPGENPSKEDGDGSGGKTANNATKPGGKNVGGSGPGGQGPQVEPTPQDPNAAFAKIAGELQLEKLKDLMTPEKLKEMGWSEADWRQFLKEARAYQELQRRQKAASSAFKKANTNGLPSAPVREVDLNRGNQIDPLTVDGAQPPPEFRDAQRQFTSSSSGKK